MSVREPRIARRSDGAFDLDIPPDQRDVLRDLPDQLDELVRQGDAETDPALKRLFPSADLDDPEHASEFDQLVHGELVAQRHTAVETMRRTIDADRLTEDEMASWLAVVNDLRLVLGTRLDVTEETTPDEFGARDPRTPVYALYAYLTYLEETIVEALSGEPFSKG
jgi:hypothetical protein